MRFVKDRAEALRSAIYSTLDWLRIHSGDTATLLTEHLALLQEAELIYLTDAFVGEGEEQGRRHPEDVDQPAETEWIGWAGGKMPVRLGTRIEVVHRSGKKYPTVAGGDYAVCWAQGGYATDIVAYKVVK